MKKLKIVYIWIKEGIIRHKYTQLEEMFWRWLAYRVSKHLIYWATLRFLKNDPDNKDTGYEAIPNISTYEALDRWVKSRVAEGYYK